MLRPYQQDAIGGITKAHEGGHIPLCVMATGTGKTHVFVEYAKTTRSRVMIVAERSEIVLQAREKVDSVGETVGVEMGQMTVQEMIWGRPRFVCASIQTLNSIRRGQRRMNKFDWNSFSLLVIDEAHHAVSPSYRRLIDLARTENPDILVLGVTATPDRLDKQGMNKVFTKVAYKYEMLQAINDGYLCPISQRLVTVKSLDFTDVKTAQGDLSISDLDRVMRYEKNLHGVVMPTLEISGDRQTLIFASSIKHAERMAEIINRHKPDQAVIITGKLEADERAARFERFKTGDAQYLVNVQVATEGWDCPPVSCIAIARPTKSRALYTQMVGRGTRPIVPVTASTADGRKAQIRESNKPNCIVLDFVGNSAKHQLVSAFDLVAPEMPTRVRDVVRQKIREAEEAGEPLEYDEVDRVVQEAAEEEARRQVRANVAYSTHEVSPFNALGITPKAASRWTNNNPISEKQMRFLEGQGIKPDKLKPHEQRQVMNELFRRSKKKLCSMKQMALLDKFGYTHTETKTWTFSQASEKIDQIAKNGWRSI